MYVHFTHSSMLSFVVLFALRFNVPVNNFSVMSGRSHRFLGFNQYSRELMGSGTQHGVTIKPLLPISYLNLQTKSPSAKA